MKKRATSPRTTTNDNQTKPRTSRRKKAGTKSVTVSSGTANGRIRKGTETAKATRDAEAELRVAREFGYDKALLGASVGRLAHTTQIVGANDAETTVAMGSAMPGC